ncbi:hypothetical protein AMTR_s00102p00123060 [Amborella trichopoda]|uniref:F-box associated domain-containing protein n=1 Tax=Amborella trichopoda TaxID=13333 RepID=W1NY31_AMBTC|nr:hypothetical protein AMTR_s00102p00123060 [Amborella trichopoda]
MMRKTQIEPRLYWICNPISGDKAEIPRPNSAYNGTTTMTLVVEGSAPHDYMILRFLGDSNKDSFRALKYEIFDSRLGSWNSLKNMNQQLLFHIDGPPAIVNGNLHWLYWSVIKLSTKESSDCIYAFRLEGGETDEFRIELPEGIKGGNEHYVLDPTEHVNVTQCEAYVSVFCNFHFSLKIWILSDYSRPVWMRKYSISLVGIVTDSPFTRISLLRILQAGVILIRDRNKFMLLELSTRKLVKAGSIISDPPVRVSSKILSRHVFPYEYTLVQEGGNAGVQCVPKGGGESDSWSNLQRIGCGLFLTSVY